MSKDLKSTKMISWVNCSVDFKTIFLKDKNN